MGNAVDGELQPTLHSERERLQSLGGQSMVLLYYALLGNGHDHVSFMSPYKPTIKKYVVFVKKLQRVS